MIRSVFYSEFDNIKGPIVLFDAPPGSVSTAAPATFQGSGSGGTSLFEAVSDFAITGPQLSAHLITVCAPAEALNLSVDLSVDPDGGADGGRAPPALQRPRADGAGAGAEGGDAGADSAAPGPPPWRDRADYGAEPTAQGRGYSATASPRDAVGGGGGG